MSVSLGTSVGAAGVAFGTGVGSGGVAGSAGAAGDPYFASVASLLHFDNNLTDVKGKTVTNNGLTFSTTSKFGTHAVSFADNAYATIADSADFDFGTGDFTVEFWANKPTVTGWGAFVQIPAVEYGPTFGYVDGVSTTLLLFLTSSAGGWNIASAVSMGTLSADSTFKHFAVTRSGTTFRTYCDGAKISQFTSASALYSPVGDVGIGRYFFPGNTRSITGGQMDDLRITKGVARYTGDTYDVPTAAFPDA